MRCCSLSSVVVGCCVLMVVSCFGVCRRLFVVWCVLLVVRWLLLAVCCAVCCELCGGRFSLSFVGL